MFKTEQSSRNWSNELNEQQLEAVTHGNGPLLIVAGAGTGKTRTLAYRVAHLISEGVAPERILLLTFTRRAAEEMLKRASSAISTGPLAMRQVWGGTFHSVANRILRIHAQLAGLPQDFTIMDRSDAEDLLDLIRTDLGFSHTKNRFPKKSTCLDIYSRKVNGNEDLEVILEKYFPWCDAWLDELKTLFKEYVARKQKSFVLDYDDLLLYWYLLLQDNHVADRIGGNFDHVLVDEYQDTNRMQAGILNAMRRENKNITVVGDDAQSIYSFRSATVANMMEFPQQYPGTRLVKLEQNYRSSQPILDTTNGLINQGMDRYTKELWSEREGQQRPQLITCIDESQQDEAVVDKVLEHYEQGIPLHKQAVLFRAASHSNSLELALTRRNIPFHKYGGLKFLEAAHVKDLIGFLRILENPRDEVAWFRVLQLLNGVGPITASAVFGHVTDNGYDATSIESFDPPASARQEIIDLVQLMRDLSPTQGLEPSVKLDRIVKFYTPLLLRNYENPEPRLNDIIYLQNIAAGYTSVTQFLSELILDPPASTGDLAGIPTLDEDWLVLSTIHSAKGLEWDAVYLIHAADGFLPSDMATGSSDDIQEELRLTYVAMTRARDFLYVLRPQRYYHGASRVSDKHGYAQLCRFFTPDVVGTMDQVERDRHNDTGDDPASGLHPVDIAAQIRDMWA
ncbi:MAG: ATP-dependent helicase [Chloroflexi bacterium]|nr:ATP-dependent helicase [Chloroflexota bacterium]